MTLELDYYYGSESEQFTFYRIPKVLMTDERFRTLSVHAKVLYGLMLDRMGLSMKNGWLDDDNRVYIIYKVEEIANDLNCGHTKANDVLKELSTKDGIGLIEKKRMGLGKPDLIYVKNFMTALNSTQVDAPKIAVENQNTDMRNSADANSDSQENRKTEIKTSDIRKATSPSIDFPDFRNTDIRFSDTETSKNTPISPFEVREAVTNNNYRIETNQNNTENQSFPITQDTTDYGTDRLDSNEHKQAYKLNSSSFLGKQGQADLPAPDLPTIKNEDVMEYNIKRIKDQISYDILVGECDNKDIVDAIVNLMAEVISYWKGNIRINSQSLPVEVVKKRFLQHNIMTMQYVLECLSKTDTKVHNIQAYYLTVLYNAPSMIEGYYQAEYNHDRYEYAMSH